MSMQHHTQHESERSDSELISSSGRIKQAHGVSTRAKFDLTDGLNSQAQFLREVPQRICLDFPTEGLSQGPGAFGVVRVHSTPYIADGEEVPCLDQGYYGTDLWCGCK